MLCCIIIANRLRALWWVDWSSEQAHVFSHHSGTSPLFDIISPCCNAIKHQVQVLRFALAHCRSFVHFIGDLDSFSTYWISSSFRSANQNVKSEKTKEQDWNLSPNDRHWKVNKNVSQLKHCTIFMYFIVQNHRMHTWTSTNNRDDWAYEMQCDVQSDWLECISRFNKLNTISNSLYFDICFSFTGEWIHHLSSALRKYYFQILFTDVPRFVSHSFPFLSPICSLPITAL